MLAGTELIRRKLGKNASAMTIPLLTNSEGKKMGKTVAGALWLDEEKTSVYDFFQYWRNVDDADVIKCLKMITFLPLEEIAKMENLEGSDLNKAKEILAFEVTKQIHGEEKAKGALEAARAVFSGGSSENMPEVKLSDEDFTDGKIDAISLAFATGIFNSRSEARRTIQQGGIFVNKEKVESIEESFDKEIFKGEVIVQRGKKKFFKFSL